MSIEQDMDLMVPMSDLRIGDHIRLAQRNLFILRVGSRFSEQFYLVLQDPESGGVVEMLFPVRMLDELVEVQRHIEIGG